ncbi:MAG: hypothetical protein WC076_10810 [Terrimicrobiaceae bacterium]
MSVLRGKTDVRDLNSGGDLDRIPTHRLIDKAFDRVNLPDGL